MGSGRVHLGMAYYALRNYEDAVPELRRALIYWVKRPASNISIHWALLTSIKKTRNAIGDSLAAPRP